MIIEPKELEKILNSKYNLFNEEYVVWGVGSRMYLKFEIIPNTIPDCIITDKDVYYYFIFLLEKDELQYKLRVAWNEQDNLFDFDLKEVDSLPISDVWIFSDVEDQYLTPESLAEGLEELL
jgi:hypothetical protein